MVILFWRESKPKPIFGVATPVSGKKSGSGSAIRDVEFLNFEFVHPDSAGEGYPNTYLKKAIFDILSYSKRKCIFIL